MIQTIKVLLFLCCVAIALRAQPQNIEWYAGTPVLGAGCSVQGLVAWVTLDGRTITCQGVPPVWALTQSGSAISCVAAPGNTSGSYQQACQTSAGAWFSCNNSAGCTVSADWVGLAGSGSGFANPMSTTDQLIGSGSSVSGAAAALNLPNCTANGAICQYSTTTHSWAAHTLVSADIPNNAANTSGLAAQASALAGNGTNCSSGNAPLGVDASGNSESCFKTVQQFFGTAAPGSVAGNLPGDRFSDTANHNDYWCNAPSATATPACTSVTTGGWTLANGSGGGGGSVAYTTVSFSPTPTFTVGASTNIQNFQITLTGNVTSSTLNTSSATTGQDISFKICQNGTGGYTFAWPSNVVNPGNLPTGASQCGSQVFRFDGTNAVAFSSMVVSGSAGCSLLGASGVVITVPCASSDTVVELAATQTLTNKTIDGVSPTTMGYVDPTSSIQTQMNGKASVGGNIGAATATSPSACDNSTKVATTAYMAVACNTVETSGSPLAATAQSQTLWNNTSGAYVVDLPATASGLQVCIGNYKLRTGAISFVPPSGSTIYYKGVAGTTSSSTGLVSGGAAGDFICVEAVDSTTWIAIGAGAGVFTNN